MGLEDMLIRLSFSLACKDVLLLEEREKNAQMWEYIKSRQQTGQDVKVTGLYFSMHLVIGTTLPM